MHEQLGHNVGEIRVYDVACEYPGQEYSGHGHHYNPPVEAVRGYMRQEYRCDQACEMLEDPGQESGYDAHPHGCDSHEDERGGM